MSAPPGVSGSTSLMPGAAGLIIGIGSDLCDIRRIERVMARHGERFVERVFTATERARAERRTPAIRAT